MKTVSEQIVEIGERLGNVADAANGKRTQRGTLRARWMILPAAGAGLYALGTSGVLTRRAKTVVQEVKSRASDLPDELMSRVHTATRSSSDGRTTRRRSTTQSRRKTTSRR